MGDLYMKRLIYGILGITLHVPAFDSVRNSFGMGDLYMKRLIYGILGITLHVPAFDSVCSAMKGVLGRACHEDDEEEGCGRGERARESHEEVCSGNQGSLGTRLP
ncbi:unnamed protein product [Sphagnum troendelagicum]|uniref:Uncharacterized protein n=1 Tax=Sphagnum troendelagicum TaxID=128251 RepID=A0ABP0TNH3_9BRYO